MRFQFLQHPKCSLSNLADIVAAMRDLERFINQDELLAADLLIKMALTRCTTMRSDGCPARNVA